MQDFVFVHFVSIQVTEKLVPVNLLYSGQYSNLY